MTNSQPSTEELGAAFEAALTAKGFSDPLKDAMYSIAPHFGHGSNWAICPLKTADEKAQLEAYKSEGGKNGLTTALVGPKGEAYIVLAPFQFVAETVRTAGLMPEAAVEGATILKNQALKKLHAYIEKGKPGEQGVIGIYNLNASQTITINGNTYPAFNLPFDVVAKTLKQGGYAFVLNGQVVDPEVAFGSPTQFFRCLREAPSRNALLVEVRKVR